MRPPEALTATPAVYLETHVKFLFGYHRVSSWDYVIASGSTPTRGEAVAAGL